MFFNPLMFKRTPSIQFEVAYINHVNETRAQSHRGVISWGMYSQVAFVHQMQSEENGLLTIFFSVRHPHPLWYWLLPSANPSICYTPSYLQNYVLFEVCTYPLL